MTQHTSGKVVWSEGMQLLPHHFQLQSRYFETTVQAVTRYLRGDAWGFASLSVDAEALKNREAVVEARGIMPDGTPFQIPERESARLRRPLPRDLFGEDRTLDLYLTLPVFFQNGANVAAEGVKPRGVRFFAETMPVADEVSGAERQAVQLGWKNFEIKTAGETTPVDVSMRLARVLYNDGAYAIDTSVVPPSLATSAFPCKEKESDPDSHGTRVVVRISAICDIAQNLVSVIEEKIAHLAGQRKSLPTRILTEQSLAGFWLLQTLQRSLPALRHFLENPEEHPSVLYRELLRLAGALCTFALDADPARLPLYCHGDPAPGFDTLEKHIRRNLELSLPTNCIEIKLEGFDRYYFKGVVDDPRCKPDSRWILGIRSTLRENQLKAIVPPTVKVSSHKWIKRAVDTSVADVPVSYIEPPNAIDPQPGYRYFSLDGSHDDFVPVFKHKGIGIYVPASVALTDISLHAIF
jgi:type VI secretion system protein ImpJ